LCNHKTVGRWGRAWTRYAQAALGGFLVLETTAIVTGGITLSTFLQRLFGLEKAEPCHHSTAGRVFVLGFAAWLAAHIGFGKFGLGAWVPRRKH
jgi:broad specificity phosphatase PhoE